MKLLVLLMPTLTLAQVSRFSAYGGGSELDKKSDLREDSFVNSPILGDPNENKRRQNRASGSNGLPENVVSDIHCISTPSAQEFSAVVRPPPGHASPPILEGRPKFPAPAACRITNNENSGYSVRLSSMEECGVTRCTEQGENWLCLLLRLPVIPGLMLPEDEVISIKCRPQDRSVAGTNAINFQENLVEQKSPAIFTGGGQEFLSEIGLFRKLAGTELFAARVNSGSSIELGENVQLRSIVRSGDGWKFSRITNVIVHRVHLGKALTGPDDSVQLIDENGCRNSHYRALAPYESWRDESNSLINNFDFRVFMFQDMEGGDAIMITAQVVACVEPEDCQSYCSDPQRVKRAPTSEEELLEQAGQLLRTKRFIAAKGKTKDWQENLEIKVSMPDSGVRSVDSDECRLYLILTLATALTFCLLSAAIVLCACFRHWRDTRAKRIEDDVHEKPDQTCTGKKISK